MHRRSLLASSLRGTEILTCYLLMCIAIVDNYYFDNAAPSIETIKSLNVWSTHADSLFNKLEELKARIYLFNPDIIAITEIYPKYSLYEPTAIYTELNIDGYDIFYNDKFCSPWGIYLHQIVSQDSQRIFRRKFLLKWISVWC